MTKRIVAVLIYGITGIAIMQSGAEVHLQVPVGNRSIPQETGTPNGSAFDVISVKPRLPMHLIDMNLVFWWARTWMHWSLKLQIVLPAPFPATPRDDRDYSR